MADLHLEHKYDEFPRCYLESFMELANQNFDLGSKQVANLFVRGLVKESLILGDTTLRYE